MMRPSLTLACIVVLAGSFTANAVDTVDSATIALPASPSELAQLPALGPLTQVAHVYADPVYIFPWSCALGSTNHAGLITLTDLNAPGNETIIVATVVFDIVNFGAGTIWDRSHAEPTTLSLNGVNTSCFNAQSGAVAGTITGQFTNGDTFSIQVLVP